MTYRIGSQIYNTRGKFSMKSVTKLFTLPLAIMALLISPVSAQVLEEVIVTAQKREQNLQDVGVSVTAFSGEQVRNLGFTRSNEVMNQMPGVAFNSVASGGTFSLPTIRGVSQNDFAQTQEAPNAVYIDGVYMSFITGLNFALFDMERIEVLRGPQGTLYGRNATGGLFHYVTRKPTDEFEAYVDFTYGSYDQIRSEAAISGPITDQLKARLSFTSDHYDGWWENRNGRDGFDKDQFAARGQLLFEPNEDVSFHLSITAGSQNDDAGLYDGVAAGVDQFGRGVDVGGPDPFFGYEDTTEDAHNSAFNPIGFLDRKILSVAGTLEWQFENVKLTSITGYHDFDYEYLEDCDGTPIDTCNFGSGLDDSNQFSQEIRLSSEMDKLRWTFGGYYLDIENNAFGNFITPSFGPGVFAFDVESNWETDTESWAVFGQVEYDISDKFTVIGGLRWTEEEKTHTAQTRIVDCGTLVCGETAPGSGIPFPAGTLIYNYNQTNPIELLGPFAGTPVTKQDVGDWAGKIELDYRPNDDLLTYFSVTRGNKGPGFNVPLDGFLSFASTAFSEETLTSYEIGFKSTLWDGKARLNAAGFYYDYNDYQAFQLIGLAQSIINRDAEMYGGEVELTVSPGGGWDFLFGVSYLDAEVKDLTLPDGITTINPVPPQSPEWTLNGLARKEWPMFNGTVAVQMDFNYVDDYFSAVSNAPTTLQESYVLGNGRISYTSGDGKWDVAMFVKNIADADISNYTFDLAVLGVNIHSYMPPRWFGGQVRYNW